MDAFLLIEVVDDRSVFAGESLEALFAAGIREAAAIEDEAAAIAAFVLGQALVKRKTENAHDKIVGFGGEALQFFRGQHAFESVHERRERDGQPDVMKQPAEIFQRVGHALQEMRPAFEETAKTVSAEGLHDADINVGIVVAEESFAIEGDEAGKAVKIVIEELLAQIGREVGLGVVQERSDVVLQSAFAATLVVDEKRIAVAQHDVAGLEVTVEKIIARGTEKKFGETSEVFFKGMFVEGDAGEAEKIVFEIIQIPGDGLAVENGVGETDFGGQVAAGFHLEAGQPGGNLAIGFRDLGGDIFASAVVGKELEERGVAEVFFKIDAVGEIFGIDFRNGKPMTAKVFGECEEGGVFFAYTIEDADGSVFFVGEPDDFAAGAAEFALQRLDVLGWCLEILLEKLFENVQGHGFPSDAYQWIAGFNRFLG